MSYQPTVFGTKSNVEISNIPVVSTIVLPVNFPANVTVNQEIQLKASVDSFDLENMKLLDIATLGENSYTSLNKILDQFLALIDPKEEPKIYGLVSQLGKSLDEENLNGLAENILNPKINAWSKLKSLFSKEGATEAANQALQKLRELAGQKTQRIATLISTMEQTLQKEMIRLGKEIASQEKLKDQYSVSFDDFALETLFLHNCVIKAKAQFAELEKTEPVGSSRLEDFRAKLQALESRALAIEGTLTRLPSDQLVIRQLQNAGISTIQETSTTASNRFASIKMTLLTINGALVTEGLQRLSQQGADLDKNLQDVKSKLMKKVVTSAALAPGQNRLEQANQLKKIVQDTKDLQQIVEDSRVTNKISFAEASKIFSEARQDVLQLGTAIKPLEKLGS